MHLRSRRNIALDRIPFAERRQQPGESFDDFLVAPRKLGAIADLCHECHDQRITTHIMLGIRDVELKTKLLAMHPYPPSQEAIDLCRSVESASVNTSELSSPATSVHTQTQINIASISTTCQVPILRRVYPPGSERMPSTQKQPQLLWHQRTLQQRIWKSSHQFDCYQSHPQSRQEKLGQCMSRMYPARIANQRHRSLCNLAMHSARKFTATAQPPRTREQTHQ